MLRHKKNNLSESSEKKERVGFLHHKAVATTSAFNPSELDNYDYRFILHRLMLTDLIHIGISITGTAYAKLRR